MWVFLFLMNMKKIYIFFFAKNLHLLLDGCNLWSLFPICLINQINLIMMLTLPRWIFIFLHFPTITLNIQSWRVTLRVHGQLEAIAID